MAAFLLGTVPAIADTAERVETFGRGPVQMTVSVRPARIEPHRDALLVLRAVVPRRVEVELPVSLADRLQGFELRGVIESDPVERQGKIEHEWRLLLTPLVAREYRLAPFPVRYTDRNRDPPVSDWFPTRPILFDFDAPPASDEGIAPAFDPVRVWPGPRTWALYGAVALAIGMALFLLRRLFRKAGRAIRRWRMAPRERALAELADLLAKDLIASGQIKMFYLELTGVVRRYIERAHKIRAPEQTTQEFLEAASRSPRFRPDALAKLKDFLEAADMVKFAAWRPPEEDIRQAVATARSYIEADAAPAQQEPEDGHV